MLKTARDLKLADPAGLAAADLEDYGAAWAQHFRISRIAFARGQGEHDGLYRPRLIALIVAHRTAR